MSSIFLKEDVEKVVWQSQSLGNQNRRLIHSIVLLMDPYEFIIALLSLLNVSIEEMHQIVSV